MILIQHLHIFRIQQFLLFHHQIENCSVNELFYNTKLFFLVLVPDRCTNDIMGLEHFTRVFHARFGSTGPILYIGSLDQAIQDSVLASRNEVNQ